MSTAGYDISDWNMKQCINQQDIADVLRALHRIGPGYHRARDIGDEAGISPKITGKVLRALERNEGGVSRWTDTCPTKWHVTPGVVEDG